MTGQILITAAGSSRRMRGQDKLLEDVDGTPQLRRITEFATQTGWPVLVTLPDIAGKPAQALVGLGATLVPVPDHADGMAASLKAGYAKVQHIGASGLMIVPADMPDLDAGDLCKLIAAHVCCPNDIHCGASGTTRGHPVVLPHWLLPKLLQLTGDRGAKSLIEENLAHLQCHQLQGKRAVLDLDTPESWREWRAAR